MIASRFAAVALATALTAAPVFAQSSTSTTPGGSANPTVGAATPGAAPTAAGGMDSSGTMGASSSSHNPVLTDSGDVRASQVIGSSVYNDKNEKIGSVDDILMDKDQKASQAVISVGGVLGVGAKLVAVPFEKLKFSDKVDDKTSRVMMPGGDANALNGMPTYHYASK